jgi:glutathione S-transferase
MVDYTLYYWPIPFRGHFIRYVLAEAGAEWHEPGYEAVAGLKDLPVAEQPYPFLAPPLLHDPVAGNYLSQMPAIVMYLGRKHGLSRDADLELRLLCDADDILFEITRNHGAQMWDAPSWAEFTNARLPRWMQLHERLFQGSPSLGGAAPGLGDLVLGALWHTMTDRLPGLRGLLRADAPGVEAHVWALAERPAIAAMLGAWRDGPMRYCAGQIEASLLAMLSEEGKR